MLPVNRISNWLFVSADFQGSTPPHRWTRFEVTEQPAGDTAPMFGVGNDVWPLGYDGPRVEIPRAWYDELRYRIEHGLTELYRKLLVAQTTQATEEVDHLLALIHQESQMTWSEARPMLIREVLREW